MRENSQRSEAFLNYHRVSFCRLERTGPMSKKAEMKRDERYLRGVDLTSTSLQQMIVYLLGGRRRVSPRSFLFINLTVLHELRFSLR